MWQPLPVRSLKGLGMKVARQPACSASVLVMYLKKDVAIGGDEDVVVFPVHLELAVGVLVVVLIGPASRARACRRRSPRSGRTGASAPSGRSRAWDTRRRRRRGSCRRGSEGRTRTRRRSSSGDPASFASAICFFSTLRGASGTGAPSHQRSAAEPTHLTLPRAIGSGSPDPARRALSGWAGVMSRWVAKPAKPAPFLCI